MFGSVGIPELIMIFIVALLLFGPKKLPEIGRSLGKALGEFKRATNDLQRSLEEEVAADDLRQTKRELDDALKPGVAKTSDSSPVPPPTAGSPLPAAGATVPAGKDTAGAEPSPSPTEPR